MSKASKQRSSVKPPASSKSARPTGAGSGSKRQTPGRLGKARVMERILSDTRHVRQGSFLTPLRKQGYEELPLDEIQDRLSKLRTALAEFIVSRRG